MLTLALAALSPVPARPTAPPPAEVVIAEDQFLIRPGPVLRATSLDGPPPLPADGVSVTLHCLLTTWGALGSCRAQPGDEAWAPFALRRLRGYTVKRTAADRPRSDLEVPAALTVRLLPSDRAGLSISGEIDPNATLVTMTGPIAEAASLLYPARALRAEIQATVSLNCRILDSYEILCPEGRMIAAGTRAAGDERAILEPMFVFAAQQMIGQARAAPLLTDGRPAAGHQFHTNVVFRLPDLGER